MSTADPFYRDLEPFHHFLEEAFQAHFYRPLPADWLLVITDISASSKAVESGKYAQVNYVGAACIVAVRNALQHHDVPTVFGGDGATLAIPPSLRTTTITALIATQQWARTQFKLDLRIGVVPVADLYARGSTIEVAKMEFSPNNSMAMFRGSGFDIADAWVKADDGTQGYRIKSSLPVNTPPDLRNLSCRWAPMSAENGVIICLIVAARATDIKDSDSIYRDVISHLNEIVALNSEQASPVKLSKLRVRLRWSAFMNEVKTLSGPLWQRWLLVFTRQLAQILVFKLSLHPGDFDPLRYKQETIINADFRKISGMLRMIIDCTPQQAKQIEAMLMQMHEAKQVHFGIHRAKQAIMTCMTPNVDNHEHIHFIDGGDGGLYSAARQLKAQLAQDQNISSNLESKSSTTSYNPNI